jgi:hypothetical protein
VNGCAEVSAAFARPTFSQHHGTGVAKLTGTEKPCDGELYLHPRKAVYAITKESKMAQKRKKITSAFLVSTILSLLLPFTVSAAATDDFIRGYGAAVMEREFQIKNYSLEVSEGKVTVKTGELKKVSPEKVIAALFAVQGVKQVEILNSEGVVIASSTTAPPQGSTVSAAAQEQPAYELGFLPGGNLFDPLIADPRWPHFSMAYQRYLDDAELKNVAAVSFGETISLYRSHAPFGGLWEVGFQAGIFSIFDLDGPRHHGAPGPER